MLSLPYLDKILYSSLRRAWSACSGGLCLTALLRHLSMTLALCRQTGRHGSYLDQALLQGFTLTLRRGGSLASGRHEQLRLPDLPQQLPYGGRVCALLRVRRLRCSHSLLAEHHPEPLRCADGCLLTG